MLPVRIALLPAVQAALEQTRRLAESELPVNLLTDSFIQIHGDPERLTVVAPMKSNSISQILKVFPNRFQSKTRHLHMSRQQWPNPGQDPAASPDQDSEVDTSHRPANAFILSTQTMRSAVRQANPSLSNTEVSRMLGQLWKDVPGDVKLQYKQQATVAQEEFKRQHPNYTYRKARRKRALNELLTNGAQGFPAPGFASDPSMAAAMFNQANPYWMQMYAQAQPGGVPGQGHPPPGYPNMGMPCMPGPQGYSNIPGYPPLGDPNQTNLYQYPPK
jgi:hypothetical protein